MKYVGQPIDFPVRPFRRTNVLCAVCEDLGRKDENDDLITLVQFDGEQEMACIVHGYQVTNLLSAEEFEHGCHHQAA